MSQSKGESYKYIALCKALEDGDMQTAENLIFKNAPVNPKTLSFSNTPLHWAVIKFDILELIKILVYKGAEVQAKNKNGHTPIYFAIMHNREEIAKFLINKVWDIHDDLVTLITGAAANGNKNLIDLLIEYSNRKNIPINVINALSAAVENRDSNVRNYLLEYCKTHGLTNQYIFHDAVMKNGPNSKEVLDLLHQSGFTIFTLEDENYYQSIYKAVHHRHLDIARSILETGININVNNKETGLALLHVAGINGDTNMVQLLLEHKPNLNVRVINGLIKQKAEANNLQQSFIGKTPLFIAVLNSDVDIVHLLLANDAGINEEPDILFTAVQKSTQEIIKLLLDHGADVNAFDVFQGTPLLYSIVQCISANEFFTYQFIQDNCLCNDLEEKAIVELLLKNGGNPNPHVDGNIYSPLQASILEGYLNIGQLLLQYNADVNYSDIMGNTPLHFAVNCNSKILDLILEQNPNINVANIKCSTPLHYAAAVNNYDAIDKLLKRGANVHDIDNSGNTALHLVCQKCKNSDTVQLLLNYNANFNPNMNGETPLHTFLYNNTTAKEKEYIKIIKVLLKNGADVNAVDCEGTPPLIYACSNLSIEIVKFLLAHGADVNCTDSNGKTSLHIAVKKDDPDNFQYLLSKGADINKLCNENKTVLHEIQVSLDNVDFTDIWRMHAYASRAQIRLKLFNIAKEHAIKLNSAKMIVSERNVNIIYKNENICEMVYELEGFFGVRTVNESEFEGQCNKEIENLKKEKIGFITWYSFLTKDIHELTKFIRNERLIKTLHSENFEKQFPLYTCIMRNRCALAVERYELLENVRKYFLCIFRVLPLICTDQIFCCLNTSDLKALISAVQ